MDTRIKRARSAHTTMACSHARIINIKITPDKHTRRVCVRVRARAAGKLRKQYLASMFVCERVPHTKLAQRTHTHAHTNALIRARKCVLVPWKSKHKHTHTHHTLRTAYRDLDSICLPCAKFLPKTSQHRRNSMRVQSVPAWLFGVKCVNVCVAFECVCVHRSETYANIVAFSLRILASFCPEVA